MKSGIKFFSLILLFACIFIYADTAQAAPQRVCMKADGSIVVKRRCKASKGQTEVSINSLSTQGTQGPAGAHRPSRSRWSCRS